MISVTITDKDGTSTTSTFDKEEILIGRIKGNDVVLPRTNVSKRHARIVVKENHAILVDLKSLNGTFVNGQKINVPRPLVEGDKVYIGDFTLEVHEMGGASSAPAAPNPGMSAVPGFGGVGGHAEPRPLGSISGLPSLGGQGAPLPSLTAGPALGAGGIAPLGGATGVPGAPSLTGLPPVGGAAPVGPGAAPLGPGASPLRGSTMGPGSAPIGPGATMGPAASPISPANGLGVGGGIGASPAAAGPTIGAGLGALPSPAASPVSPSSLRGTSVPAGPAVSRMPGIQPDAPKPGDSSAEKSPRLQQLVGADIHHAGAGSQKDDKLAEVIAPAALPEDIVVDDARTPECDAMIKAARIVMDAYLGQVDFQNLVSQPYPPEPDIQDACYGQLEGIANANRGRLGNVNIEALLEFLLKEVCGLGAIDSLIDDENVTDFTVYNFETIVCEKSGRRVLSELQFTSVDTLYLAAQRILSYQGLTEQSAPAVSEIRMGDGTQLEVVLSPVSITSPFIVVRKTCRKFKALPALVQSDMLTGEMAKFLTLCVKARRNILVVGPQGSGRTSILNALGSEISSGERVATIEKSAMMNLSLPYVVSLEAQNANYGQGFDLASLVRSASKLRAERVILDTIQLPQEASAFLGAVFAGAQGSMASISGLTANDGIASLKRMVASDQGMPATEAVSAINIVVTTRAFSDARRRIVEISEVLENADGSLEILPVFTWQHTGMGNGQFKACGNVPFFCRALERGGVSIDMSMFNA